MLNECVECRSDYDYAGRPVAFYWLGQRLEVERVISQWQLPHEKCFRVSTMDGQVFVLCYVFALDEWQIRQP